MPKFLNTLAGILIFIVALVGNYALYDAIQSLINAFEIPLFVFIGQIAHYVVIVLTIFVAPILVISEGNKTD